MSIRALDRFAWGADAPWGPGPLVWLGFPLLCLSSVLLWFLPSTLATAAGAGLAVALLLAIPLLWREGYTLMVLWLAPIAAFDPLPTPGVRAAKYVLLAAAILIAIAKRNLSKEAVGRYDIKAVWPSVVLLGWLWFRALLGAEPLAGALEAGRLTLVAGVAWLWLTEPPRAGARRHFFALWMAMAAFQATVCLVEASALGALRSYGTFPNANAMGSYLVISGGLCFSFAVCSQRRLPRLGLWVLFAVLLFAMYLTGSRAAWVALLVCLLVSAATARHWRSLTVGILLLAAVGVVYLTSPVFRMVTQAALRFQTGLTHRPILWEAADRAALDVPPWGYGLETTGDLMTREARYPSEIHREILAPMMTAGNPHNFYRELWLETGPIGMALLLWVVWALLRSAWRHRASPDRSRRAYALTLLGVTSGLLLHSYFERSLFLGSMSSAIFFWFLVTQALREDEPGTALAAPATPSR